MTLPPMPKVSSAAEAEASCAAQGMRYEWQADGGLVMYEWTPGFLPAREGDAGTGGRQGCTAPTPWPGDSIGFPPVSC